MELQDTFTYTYNLFASNTHLQIFILVESEPDQPDYYTFSLSVKIGHVERALSTPVTMKLSVDPRRLNFIAFAFPPRSSLPTGCLYHLRVWLRTVGADHRIFAEKDLWFGKDPDFYAIPDASFAYLRNVNQDMAIYQGTVGRAHVSFIFRWTVLEPETYALSLDYEAGGAGKTLFENYPLRLYCEPQSVSFVIYSIPVPSSPAGASHRLRVWLRTPHAVAPHARSQSQSHFLSLSHSRSQSQPLSPEPSEPSGPSTLSPSRAIRATSSYVYQRLWKTDDLKIGAHLAFESVGHKIILATPDRTTDDPRTRTGHRRVSRLAAPTLGAGDPSESVDDR
ncbi:hypothetical protein OG21DRAFT_419815 [Imleria badia]|nr:hypothetical protein OG21DRAFT_419815 [Imleria badia]